MCILNIERLKAFLGLKEWKSSCTEKEMQFFMRVLGTDTGKTYSKVDRNHCFFWGYTATEKCQNNTLCNYHFCTNDALDHFAALICYWGYTISKPSLSGDSTQSKLTQLLQSHLRNSNQFITDRRATYLLFIILCENSKLTKDISVLSLW